MYVRDNTSLQVRIMRLSRTFKDFRTSDVRATAAFRQYRRLRQVLADRWTTGTDFTDLSDSGTGEPLTDGYEPRGQWQTPESAEAGLGR